MATITITVFDNPDAATAPGRNGVECTVEGDLVPDPEIGMSPAQYVAVLMLSVGSSNAEATRVQIDGEEVTL